MSSDESIPSGATPQFGTSNSQATRCECDLWVPPPFCVDPEQRSLYSSERALSAPRYIYLLWVRVHKLGEAKPSGRLLRSYFGHALAAHDAFCWLLSQQQRAGATFQLYSSDLNYENRHQRRCFRFATPPDLSTELGVTFSAWTTQEVLY